MVKTILVGLGSQKFSCSATDHAIALAQQHGARVTAVNLFDPDAVSAGSVPIGAGDTARELREHRRQQTLEAKEAAIKYFSESAEAASIKHCVVPDKGTAIDRLVAQARYQDLVVLGLKHLFASATIEDPPHELIKVVEGGVRPLIAVSDNYRQVNRALIAYSGSTESAKTMRRFVQQRLWPQAALRIVHFGADQGTGEELLADAATYCQAHGFQPETEWVNQGPKAGLLTYAAGWDADLLVMGNSAKTLLLRRLVGETALHVVANSQCPIYLSQ